MVMVTQVKVGPESDPILVEPGNPYSCVWQADVSLSSFATNITENYFKSLEKAVLYTEETPRNEEYDYEKILEMDTEENTLFFRAGSEEFDLTWEKKSNGKIYIGFISDVIYPFQLKRVYEDTTESRLEIQHLKEFERLVKDYINK